MPTGGMCDKCREGSKLDGIGEHICNWKIHLRVSFVGHLIKDEIGRQDPADIVRSSCIVKYCGRKDRKICGEEDVLVVCSTLASERNIETPAYTLWAP